MITNDARNQIAAGMVLVAKYKGVEYAAQVFTGGNGKPWYRLAGGSEFSSPSAAGKAITGRTSCDGWKFWSIS